MSDRQRKLAKPVDELAVDHWWLAVDAEDRDIRAVDRSAHVEAASQGNSHLSGKSHGAEFLEQAVHDGLNYA